MTINRELGQIRITAPMVHGEAAPLVRSSWHLVPSLPCHPVLGYNDESRPEHGIISGRGLANSQYGFSVPQNLAVTALEAIRPLAAQWLRDRGYPHEGECFFFFEHEAEIISGVTRQEIIVVPSKTDGNLWP